MEKQSSEVTRLRAQITLLEGMQAALKKYNASCMREVIEKMERRVKAERPGNGNS